MDNIPEPSPVILPNNFIITVCEDLWDNNFVPKSNVLEKIYVEKESLLSALIQYYEKYK